LVGAKVGVLVLVLVGVGLGSGVAVAVAVGGNVDVVVGSSVGGTAQAVSKALAKTNGIRLCNLIIYLGIRKTYKYLIKKLLLIARNSVTLKFIPNFREVITGIIKPTGVITSVSVITTPIVETVLGFAIYVLASVRAIISVIIYDIVDKTCIKNLGEDGVQMSFIGVKSERHFIFPKNFSFGNALHVI
jgi:hypothetical protein